MYYYYYLDFNLNYSEFNILNYREYLKKETDRVYFNAASKFTNSAYFLLKRFLFLQEGAVFQQ